MLTATFSSPYADTPLSYSPYYIPVYLVFSSPVAAPSLSAIRVSHGLLTNLHYTNDRWLFYLSSAHQGVVRIWAEANAFDDDAGRASRASNVLSLEVEYATVQCALLAPLVASGRTLIEVRLHCEREMPVGTNDLTVTNATVHSLTVQDDSTLSILVNPTAKSNTITVGLTQMWRVSHGAKCSDVTIAIDRSIAALSDANTAVFSHPSTPLSDANTAVFGDANPPVLSNAITIDELPTCSFEVTPLIYSAHSSFAVSVICSQPITAVTPEWLLCPNCTTLYDVTTSPNHRRVVIVAPYTTALKLEVLNGALQSRSGEYLGAITPVVMDASCQRPKVTLALEKESGNNMASAAPYTFQFSATFSTAMIHSSIDTTSNLEVVKSEEMAATLMVVSVTDTVVKFRCELSAFGDVQITYKGGTAYSQKGVPNQASQSLLVHAAEPFFSVSSSMDAAKEVFSDQVAVRLQAPALLTSIHAAEFVTQRCEIIKFVRGSIGGSTVIDMMVLVQEEGDFVVTLPRRAVALTTGVTNEEWTLRLKYTRGGCCQRE